MRAAGDAVRLQPVGQGEAQGIGKSRRQHRDLTGRNALLVHQIGNLGGDPIQHLREEAVIFEFQRLQESRPLY